MIGSFCVTEESNDAQNGPMYMNVYRISIRKLEVTKKVKNHVHDTRDL